MSACRYVWKGTKVAGLLPLINDKRVKSHKQLQKHTVFTGNILKFILLAGRCPPLWLSQIQREALRFARSSYRDHWNIPTDTGLLWIEQEAGFLRTSLPKTAISLIHLRLHTISNTWQWSSLEHILPKWGFPHSR